ncbi:RNA-binding protein [Sporobolomyces koalae]|uniref:RNA-binding protein n=1 Tax=Sporobolomyces koalae TaxID=500713 RepID=UPI0031718795
MSYSRHRSGSLELDYEDEPIMTVKEEPEVAMPKPIATLEVARREQVETRPQIAPPSKPVSAPLMSGLPANPLTGRVPSATPAGSTAASTSHAGAANPQMTAVFVSDLHWWTSDQHLVELCHLAGASNVKLKDVSFSEHKVNGKSKGVAYIETGSPEAAALVKRFVDQNEYQEKRMTCTLVIGANLGSPFKTLPREPHQRNQPGQSHNPANQSARPGLRIPPPCTYPYINSREGGTSGGGASNNTLGGQQQGYQQKRQFVNGPGQSQPSGMGMASGMGMSMMNGGQNGYSNNNNRQQQSASNAPNFVPNPAMQPQQAAPNMFDPTGMGGMGMFGMNPFGAMGGMGGMMGAGGFNPMAGFGGGFDMSQFGGAGAMDFSQMGQFGGMTPVGQGQMQQAAGNGKRSRTDGQ